MKVYVRKNKDSVDVYAIDNYTTIIEEPWMLHFTVKNGSYDAFPARGHSVSFVVENKNLNKLNEWETRRGQ